MPVEKKQKVCALISDLSGFGRCSLAAAVPIISACGIECAILPTGYLSNHTGYPSWSSIDLTDQMIPVMQQWKKIGVSLDAVLTGYFFSARQVELAMQFMEEFNHPSLYRVVDPIMGDNGSPYPGISSEQIEAMKELCAKADLILPNITEAALLCGRNHQSFNQMDLEEMAQQLQKTGTAQVVISGFENQEKNTIEDLVLNRQGEIHWICHPKTAASRPGTGDVFASAVCAELLNGKSLQDAVDQAGAFVGLCLEKSIEFHVPENEGVPFEAVLLQLSTNL